MNIQYICSCPVSSCPRPIHSWPQKPLVVSFIYSFIQKIPTKGLLRSMHCYTRIGLEWWIICRTGLCSNYSLLGEKNMFSSCNLRCIVVKAPAVESSSKLQLAYKSRRVCREKLGAFKVALKGLSKRNSWQRISTMLYTNLSLSLCVDTGHGLVVCEAQKFHLGSATYWPLELSR
jgi:hypothetical protein